MGTFQRVTLFPANVFISPACLLGASTIFRVRASICQFLPRFFGDWIDVFWVWPDFLNRAMIFNRAKIFLWTGSNFLSSARYLRIWAVFLGGARILRILPRFISGPARDYFSSEEIVWRQANVWCSFEIWPGFVSHARVLLSTSVLLPSLAKISPWQYFGIWHYLLGSGNNFSIAGNISR